MIGPTFGMEVQNQQMKKNSLSGKNMLRVKHDELQPKNVSNVLRR